MIIINHVNSTCCSKKRWIFSGIGFVILLAVIASFLSATWLNGAGNPSPRQLDTGWSYLHDGILSPIDSLPVTLDVDEKTVILCRKLTDEEKLHSRYVLVVQSWYASIKVWADDILIYEAAEGQEHALGSMWHFIPMSQCVNADRIILEFHPYGSRKYTVENILLDTPGAIRYLLLMDHILNLLFSSICLILAFIIFLDAIRLKWWKGSIYTPLLSFALFLFLSGTWIFLDSKIITIGGGNYALSYFLNYAVCYLTIVPFLFYVQLMTKNCRRILHVLIWLLIFSSGISFLLHMIGLVQIRQTAIIIHMLIIVSLPVCTTALWKNVVWRKEKQLRFTFFGILFLSACNLISVALYYLHSLPAHNRTFLYMIGLSFLITGTIIDLSLSLRQFRRMRDDAERYRRLAVEDSMTQLGNRNAFEIHLNTLLEYSPKSLAFVIFDVDNLKQINDQMGHHIGDQAIYTAAHCIRAVFEEEGNCYRIGGDEFAVILMEKPIPQIFKLLNHFQQEVTLRWNTQLPSSGISYGWAIADFSSGKPVTKEALAQLHIDADRSLYQQKQAHKSK